MKESQRRTEGNFTIFSAVFGEPGGVKKKRRGRPLTISKWLLTG